MATNVTILEFNFCGLGPDAHFRIVSDFRMGLELQRRSVERNPAFVKVETWTTIDAYEIDDDNTQQELIKFLVGVAMDYVIG